MSKFKGEYPPNWQEIAKAIKDECDWKCIRCGHPHESASGHCLTIHHLDNNKSNCAWFNLACLCQRCHLTIQSKVVLERAWYLPHSEWFKPYAAGYYAHINGLPDDKESVLAYMDELLEIGQAT